MSDRSLQLCLCPCGTNIPQSQEVDLRIFIYPSHPVSHSWLPQELLSPREVCPTFHPVAPFPMVRSLIQSPAGSSRLVVAQ